MKLVKICVLVLAVCLIISGCAWGEKRIGKDAALQIALDDAGLTRDQVTDVSVDLEREMGSSWYEVDFEKGLTEYEYTVNATTGEIISSGTD